ncbi:MAG: di-trans,poly-cis-decaprenylcistransferase [Bradymonadaceae bacterium]|nr:di-trans,poly-cis-decaprenylcistransferase [Lujinxingiaceae bacterium]
MTQNTTSPKLNLSVNETLLAAFDGPIPRHVAIIMDGNGRWATSRGMNRLRGHHEGANAVRRTVESCRYLGVEVLTIYAFSSQNWQRPVDEVSGLMTLFDLYIKKERKLLMDNNVAIRIIGDRTRLSDKLQAAIVQLEEATAPGAKMVLQVAVSYGGREEILGATRALCARVEAGEFKASDVDEALFSSHLYTAGQPDPDLVIRTSGEFRISNFLLWQLAYAEIYVTDVLWPDFDEAHLLEAFGSFGRRERRFGLTGAQVKA